MSLRAPDFFRSVVDANEGLYAVAARELLAGHLPYTTVWECKPPLFFATIASAMWFAGPTFLALRLASTLAAIAATIGVYFIGARFSERGSAVGPASAILFAALMCSDSGSSAEAEVFYSAFIIVAIALLAPAFSASRPLRLRDALGAGLCAGLATQMKVSAAPDAAFVLALIAFAPGRTLRRTAAALAACALPIVAGILPYLVSHQLDAYLDANLWTIGRRFAGPKPLHPPFLDVAREQLEAFFPAWLFVPFVMTALRKTQAEADRRLLAVLSLWLLCNLAMLIPMREFLGYQFVPAMGPAALLASYVLLRIVDARFVSRAALALAAVSILAHGIGRYTRLLAPDDVARTGNYLRTVQWHPGTELYVALGDPALYLLADAPVPTKFPYPAHLLDPSQEAAAGVDGYREIAAILARGPAYIVYSGSLDKCEGSRERLICAALRAKYHLVHSAGSDNAYKRT
jgi:4-amino-4-deoxy-L-arabinose transferase-like glycosyltransferase